VEKDHLEEQVAEGTCCHSGS